MQEGGSVCGTVFEVAPDGTETVVYAFPSVKRGVFPFIGLVKDKGGNLSEQRRVGGTSRNGVVFELKK